MIDINYLIAQVLGFLFGYGPFFAALIVALSLPIVVVVFSRYSERWPDHWKLALIFGSIVIGNSMAVASSGRVIYSPEYVIAHPQLLMMADRVEGSAWFSRLSHLIALSVSASVLFLWALRKTRMGAIQASIWRTAMIYFFLSIVVSGLLGSLRWVELRVIYAPVVFTAVALLANSYASMTQVLSAVRWFLLVPMLGSLVALAVAPDLVQQTGHVSVIPGFFSMRLVGLTGHANSLGLLALIAMFLEFSEPGRKPNLFFFLIAAANLVLSQSKTMWIAAVLGALILFFYSNFVRRPKHQQQTYMLGAICVLCFVSAAVFAGFWQFSDRISGFFLADKTGLMTFTGRTGIWEITWDEFVNSPLIGYGPSLWDPLYRFEKGMLHVGQAHNQYLQTLGQSGVLGAGGLLFYLVVLLVGAHRGGASTNGFSLFLVIALMVRGFSETPMRMIGIMESDNFVHLLTFYVVAATGVRAKLDATERKTPAASRLNGVLKFG